MPGGAPEGQDPLLIAFAVAQVDAQVVVGPERLNAIGPLDQVDPVSVEVLLVAQVLKVVRAAQAVNVPVVDRQPGLVLPQQRERRAAPGPLNAEPFKNPAGQFICKNMG